MERMRSQPRTLRSRIRQSAFAIAFCLLAASTAAWGQAFTFTAGNLNYAENFDSMTATGTMFVPGWTSTDLEMRIGDGSSNAGSIYNVGTIDANERAFGSLASGTIQPVFGASFLNNTGSFIGTLSFAGFNEQWRAGDNLANEVSPFEFSFNATTIDDPAATWTPLPAFNLFEIQTMTTIATAIDGNDPANRAAIGTGATPETVGWAPGATMWIRWTDINNAGADTLLAIDDFSLAVTLGAAPKTLTWNPANGGATWNTTTTNWLDGTNAAQAFASGDIVNFTDAGLATGSNVTVQAAGVNPGAFNVSNTTGVYTFTGGPIGGSGPLSKTGAGTLVLGTTYAKSIQVNGGIVRTAASNLLDDGATLTVGNGAALDLNGNSDTIGALSLTGATVTTGAGTLTVPGVISVVPSPTDTPTNIAGNLALGTGARTIIIADTAAPEDLILNANLSGTGRITLDGSGTIRLGGDNSAQTGGFRINALQPLVIAHRAAFGPTQLFLNGGQLNIAADLTGANGISTPVSLGGDPIFSGNDLEFSGPFVFFGATPKGVAVNNRTMISGPLGDAAATDSDLFLVGNGTLTLSGDNSGYDGMITLGSGTLVAASPNALGTKPVLFSGASAELIATVSTMVGGLASEGAGLAVVRLGVPGADLTPIVLTLDTATDADFGGSIETAAGRIGALTKSGPGRQSLLGAAINGPTVVNGGALIVGGLSGTTGVTVAANATIGGAGSITLASAGAVLVNPDAIVAPGTVPGSTGILDVIGQMLLAPEATLKAERARFQMELAARNTGGSANPANNFLTDTIRLQGNISLNDARLEGSLLDGFTAAANDLFFLIINDGVEAVSGTFLDLPQNGLLTLSGPGGSAQFEISYSGDSATNNFLNGNDVVLRALTAIPEPGSAALLVLGAVFASALRGRCAGSVRPRTRGLAMRDSAPDHFGLLRGARGA